MKPVRLQISRRKGFDLQALSIATNGLPAVNVARPSKWGNPFTRTNTGGCHCNTCLAAHYQLALSDTGKKTIRAAFKGKNVACWCPPNRDCHGDVILEIAAMTDEEFERILLARNHIVDANGVVLAALEVPDLVRDAGAERPQPQRAEHAIDPLRDRVAHGLREGERRRRERNEIGLLAVQELHLQSPLERATGARRGLFSEWNAPASCGNGHDLARATFAPKRHGLFL